MSDVFPICVTSSEAWANLSSGSVLQVVFSKNTYQGQSCLSSQEGNPLPIKTMIYMTRRARWEEAADVPRETTLEIL